MSSSRIINVLVTFIALLAVVGVLLVIKDSLTGQLDSQCVDANSIISTVDSTHRVLHDSFIRAGRLLAESPSRIGRRLAHTYLHDADAVRFIEPRRCHVHSEPLKTRRFADPPA